MYVRRLQRPTTSLLSHLRTSTCERSSNAPFAQSLIPLEKTSAVSRPKLRANSTFKTGYDEEKQQQPKRGAIRPIAVFAICIPLGYALKWAFKQQDEAIAGTTEDGFIRYTLASKEDVSSTCSIFTLKPTTSSTVDLDDPALNRAITSVQFKQPQLQIARSYTLLPPKQGQDLHELRFLIRKERNGEVSRYLHRLSIGSEVELRGLCAEYILPERLESVLFLAGGTGIAPAMQITQILAGEANVHILWGNRRREDCIGGISDTTAPTNSTLWSPFWLWSSHSVRNGTDATQEKSNLVSQIEGFKGPSSSELSIHGQDRVCIDYYVDEEGTSIEPKAVARLLRLGDRVVMHNSALTRKVFVSGPDGFINHWAGPKQWSSGGEVQGPVGGVLSTLDLRGWEVVKL